MLPLYSRSPFLSIRTVAAPGLIALMLFNVALRGQAPPVPSADVIVFTNGDQLTGKFLRSAAGIVTFHSDIAGDISVGWDKVKELRSATTFAVFEKAQPLTRTPESKVPQGTIAIKNDQLEIKQATGDTKQIPIKDTDLVIDQVSFQRQVRNQPNLVHGWVGSVTGGASLVEATQNTATFTGAVTLVRQIPQVNWLLARNRTLADFNGSYGRITQPQASGAPRLPDVKSAVYHAHAERDQYLSPRFYLLGEAAFDHNFSQGLALQQIYGGGAGLTVFKHPNSNLDVKATVQYEKQQFLDTSAGTSQDLIGSTYAEAYLLKLPRSVVFTEQASYIPAYNNVHAWSANATTSLSLPLYKRLSFSLGALDTYLNDPPVAQYPAAANKRNSLQLTTGVSYSLGPH